MRQWTQMHKSPPALLVFQVVLCRLTSCCCCWLKTAHILQYLTHFEWRQAVYILSSLKCCGKKASVFPWQLGKLCWGRGCAWWVWKLKNSHSMDLLVKFFCHLLFKWIISLHRDLTDCSVFNSICSFDRFKDLWQLKNIELEDWLQTLVERFHFLLAVGGSVRLDSTKQSCRGSCRGGTTISPPRHSEAAKMKFAGKHLSGEPAQFGSTDDGVLTAGSVVFLFWLFCHLKAGKWKMASDYHQSKCCSILHQTQHCHSLRNHRFTADTHTVDSSAVNTVISFCLGLQPVEKSFWGSGSFQRSFENWILFPAVGGLNNTTRFYTLAVFYICVSDLVVSAGWFWFSPSTVYRLKSGNE